MTNNNTNTNKHLCPQCHSTHEASATCLGAAVAPGAAPAAPPGPLLAQAESLFESYLAARLVRARRNITVAKVALLRDPRSRDKRELLLRAESEAQKLETQLLAQARRAANARERASEILREAGVAPSTASGSARATDDFRTLQAAKAEIVQTAKGTPSAPVRDDHDVTGEAFLSDEDRAALRAPKLRE